VQISRNIVNGPKSNNWVSVGSALSPASRYPLTTFMFKFVFRDSSVYLKQLPFLSNMADQRKWWSRWLHYQFL